MADSPNPRGTVDCFGVRGMFGILGQVFLFKVPVKGKTLYTKGSTREREACSCLTNW